MIISIFKFLVGAYGAFKLMEIIVEKIRARKLMMMLRISNDTNHIERISVASKSDIREAADAQQTKYVTGIPGRKITPINEETSTFNDFVVDDGSQYVDFVVNADGEKINTYNGIPLFEEGVDYEDDEY